MRILLTITAILFLLPANARAATLYLKNGDRISGAVMMEQTGLDHLVFQGRYGVVNVPMAEVDKLINDQGVRVHMDGRQAGEYMTPVERSRIIRAEQHAALANESVPEPIMAPATVAPSEVPEAEEEKGLWGAEWSGSVSFGASLQSGNSDKNEITGDAELNAEWDRHRARLKSEFDRAKEEGILTEDNRSIEGIYDYFFSEEWFVNSSLALKQDDIARLDLRTTIGLGIGHQPYDEDDLSLQYIFGPTYIIEDYENRSSTDSLAAEWQLEYDQKFWDGQIALFHNHDLLVPSDETDAYLLETDTGVKVPLKAGIVAKAQVEFDWDNDPAPGTKEDDTTYSLQVGYEW